MSGSHRERVERALRQIAEDARAEGETLSPEQVEAYRTVLDSLLGPQLDPAPEGWAEEALARALPANESLAARIRERVAGAREWTADAFVRATRALEGRLVLGTDDGLALAGTRGSTTDFGPRSILYEFEPGRLILQLSNEDNVRRLDGQFVAHVDRAESIRQAKVIQQAHVDTVQVSETGRFTFTDLHEGFARVEVLWGDVRMGIDPIEV